jgi:hypothetical protein
VWIFARGTGGVREKTPAPGYGFSRSFSGLVPRIHLGPAFLSFGKIAKKGGHGRETADGQSPVDLSPAFHVRPFPGQNFFSKTLF